jgi:hypothetical protein
MYGASQKYSRIVGHAVHPYTSHHSHLINVIREAVDRWNHKENQLQQRRDDDYRFEHGRTGDRRTNSAITRVCAWIFPFENRVYALIQFTMVKRSEDPQSCSDLYIDSQMSFAASQ